MCQIIFFKIRDHYSEVLHYTAGRELVIDYGKQRFGVLNKHDFPRSDEIPLRLRRIRDDLVIKTETDIKDTNE